MSGGGRSPWRRVGPGLLVAATGVGAGDLATAAFAGGHLGVAVAWAVVVGAALKLALNEGLARWQLATGQTLLESALTTLGPLPRVLFLPYFLLWSFFVGTALMGACGAALQALLPLDDPTTAKLLYGGAASLAGWGLARRGGFAVFERTMTVCVGAMFVTVVGSAALLLHAPGELLQGLVVPVIPAVDGATGWTTALIGGVGGTVTVLCYGYWIRARGEWTLDDLGGCRLDLVLAYAVTATFGIAMVVIGSQVRIDGTGMRLITGIADHLGTELGGAARQVFLLGALAAVFSSLLGVWQSAPFLFAVTIGARRGRQLDVAALERGRAFGAYQACLATLPAVGLLLEFRRMQQLYAVVGAYFVPLLALVILILGSRRRLGRARNGPLATAVLAAAVAFFSWLAVAA